MSGDVPEGWSSAALGDVIRLEYGRALSASAREPGQIPVYGSNGVCGQHSAALIEERGIVVGRKGTAGSVTVTEGPFWPIDTTYFVVPRVEADFDWLAATLEHARLSELNEATGVPGLNRDKAYLQPILLPPLDEQRRIAEVLRSMDKAVAALGASLEAAASVRQSTLDEVMRREASSVEHLPLEAVAEVRTGLAKNAGRHGQKVSLPYLRVANVQDGWIDLSEVKTVDVDPAAVSRYSLEPGDVLLTEGGDFDKLGRGGVWTGEIEPCLHQNHVFAVRPDRTRLSSTFLALLTQSYLGRAYFLSCAKRTTNLASINSSQLKKLPVPVLSLSRQDEIASEIGSLDRFIAIEKERSVALCRLRKALSHDLLSGRVRVPDLAQSASTGRAVQPAFKRAVFAAEVVYQLHNDDRFGSVKHEKIVHLCELHLRLQDDLDRHAYKEAAGPYDPSARRSVERIFRQQKWFDPAKEDKRVIYRPLGASGGHARYFDRYFGDRKAEVQNIIDLLRPLTTQQCEIIATLYAVWNDFLIDGREPVDDEIVDGVLNNWTDSKRQIPEEKWRAALPWMRQRGVIPTGQGEKTRVAST